VSIDAVLFDLDDTLHDDTAAFEGAANDVAHEVAAEYGIDAGELASAYVRRAGDFWKRLSRDELTTALGRVRSAMWESALADVGLRNPGLADLCADAYNRYRAEHLELWPEVPALLAGLRAGGRRLGLITNGFSETHREKIALLELERSFDAIVIADEVGMVKPDPRVFLHTCAELGARAERSIMVGDRYDRDIAGAAAAGLKTVWLNVRREALPEGAPPDATVLHIADVAEALRSLGAG
jgi:HAD superfamily hydrolase (TIGR01549 family)